MNRTTTVLRPGTLHREAVEARFGMRVRAQLEESSLTLPHDVTERLRVARELAVSRARAAKAVTTVAPVSFGSATINPDGTLSARGLGGADDSWWVRLSSLLPLLLLIAGLLLIHNWERHEQIAAAADIDAALLGDALPPEAYIDPGFDEFLKSPDLPAAQ